LRVLTIILGYETVHHDSDGKNFEIVPNIIRVIFIWEKSISDYPAVRELTNFKRKRSKLYLNSPSN